MDSFLICRLIPSCVKIALHDVHEMRRLIEDGYDVNKTWVTGETPLNLAARLNYTEIIELLVDNGATDEASLSLHTALTQKNEEAALLLIERGVWSDKVGPQNRTPLQTAIKMGMVHAVVALLERGADPGVHPPNGATCSDCIPKGNGEQANRIRQLLLEFTDLNAALNAENESAIHWVLKRRMESRELDAGIQGYHHAMRVMEAILQHHRNPLLRQTIEAGRLEDFVRIFHAGVDAEEWRKESRRCSAPSVVRFQPEGDTALHVAVQHGRIDFVRFLIFDAGMSPCVEDGQGRRPVDLIQDGGPANQLWSLLTRVEDRLEFDRHAEAMLRRGPGVTAEALRELARRITAVHDVSLLLTLATCVVDPDPQSMSALLSEAFGRVIQHKLVLQDPDALLFRKVLLECRHHGWVSQDACEEWSLKTAKVNMESAAWVDDLKGSIQQLTFRASMAEQNIRTLAARFQDLREFLIRREEAEARREQMRARVALLSAALTLFGGPLIQNAIESVVNLSEPVNLLLASFQLKETDVETFLADQATGFLKNGFEGVLQQMGTQPEEFKHVLREAIVLDKQLQAGTPARAAPATRYSAPLLGDGLRGDIHGSIREGYAYGVYHDATSTAAAQRVVGRPVQA